MFDLKDESSALMNDAIGLSHVMETLDVFISIKPRPKQQSKVRKHGSGAEESDWIFISSRLLSKRWNAIITTCTTRACICSIGTPRVEPPIPWAFSRRRPPPTLAIFLLIKEAF